MSSNATSTPEPGQILAGKYLVEEILGVGGMGVVVAAKHVQLDQKVAIKYLLPSALLNPEVVERFAREARAAAKIRGEHVARVIDVGQFDDGAPYMVMEHLEGHDLARQLELHGPLSVEDAIRYMLETCEALAEAHAAKIVHRDLKPSNLFLATQPDKSTIIKVLDFGISKTGDAPSASLTKTSALMGTAFYMSPEQLTNPKGVDHRSDIWALGVILYELLSGRQPFMGESVPEIIGGILSNQPELIRTLRADVPVGLEAVIVKCMQSKTADRYQSVAALAAALGPFANVRDRLSIDITARVLGETTSPSITSSPNLSKPTILGAAPPSAVQTGSALAAAPAPAAPSTPSTPPQPSSASPPSTGAGVAAVTTHGMSTSQITMKPKRSPMPLIAGAAIVLAIGGTALGLKLSGGGGNKADAPPAAATGLVAAPQADPQPNGAPATTTTSKTNLLPIAPASVAAPVDPPPATPAA
ncbi:MAG: Serine/threonine-protein kinase pkn3, partial [Labilithrix sp.]|nr:Serine/threonine-protein kinase pkn3 [Labilithrix sp.]